MAKRPTHPRPKTVLNHFTKKWYWFELFFSVDKSSDISKNFSGTRTRESLRLKIRIVASIKNLYHSGDSIGSLLRMLLRVVPLIVCSSEQVILILDLLLFISFLYFYKKNICF